MTVVNVQGVPGVPGATPFLARRDCSSVGPRAAVRAGIDWQPCRLTSHPPRYAAAPSPQGEG